MSHAYYTKQVTSEGKNNLCIQMYKNNVQSITKCKLDIIVKSCYISYIVGHSATHVSLEHVCMYTTQNTIYVSQSIYRKVKRSLYKQTDIICTNALASASLH